MAENFPNLRKETDIQVQEAQSPSSIFSDHNDMKLEINCKKRNDKKNGYMETKTTCQWVKDKIKEETKKYLETNDNENTPIQNLWNTAKAVRGKYIGIRAFLKKNEKNLNLTYYLKEFEKEQNLKTTEGKILWRSERRQIRLKKKTWKKSIKPRAGLLKGCSVASNSVVPCTNFSASLPCPWDFPGKSTGVGCHSLLQRILPTQGSNPGLSHGGELLYHCATWEALVRVNMDKSLVMLTKKKKRKPK